MHRALGNEGAPIDERKANAAFIVRAVNNHAALVAALERIVRALGVEGHEPNVEHARETARAALANAKP